MAKFVHTPLGLSLTSSLGWFIIRNLGRTVSLDILGMDKLKPLLEKGEPGIGALWHGRHFLLVDQFRRQLSSRNKICVMTSKSRDGELLSRVLNKFHYRVVRGSSSRAAVSGFMQLIAVMKEGYDTIIAVDGPRGPREIVKPGVILLAQKTGYPIVPLSSSSNKNWIINSWDKYMIPKPFNSGVITIGEPIRVPANADRNMLESRRILLENSLREITTIADQYFIKGISNNAKLK